MENRRWIYTGNIRSYACQKNLRGQQIITEVELYDSRDDSKAPVLLHVSASLMAYIMDIENHDDEEKYMLKEFVYDNILCIREIRVFNEDGKVCKKISEYNEFGWVAEITGPAERINSVKQKELGLYTPVYHAAPGGFDN